MDKRFIPIVKWNKYHDWPTVHALMGIMKASAENGAANAFKRVGRKIVVDEQEFHKWVERGCQNAR